MNKKGKNLLKIITGATAFSAALACGYFFTPNKVRQLETSKKTHGRTSEGVVSEGEDSHFMRFVTRLSQETGVSENETKEYYGFNAEFEDFSVSFKKDETAPVNYITIDGGIDFLMKGLKNINFNLYADVDYNGYQMPIDVGYVNKTAYFGFNDLRIKVGSTTIDELIGNEEEGIESLLYKYFVATHEEGGINFNVEKFYVETYNNLINGMIDSLDFSNLTSSFKMGEIADDEAGIGLVVTEYETTDGYEFDLNVKINKENSETNEIDSNLIAVTIAVDENYRLSKVDLGTINIGNVTIAGAINFTTELDHRVYAPDDVNFVKYDENKTYVEVINYKGWLQKLAHFLDEENQKIGLDFAVNLSTTSNNSLADIGSIEGSINADFSELIDLSEYATVQEEVGNKSHKRGLEIDTESLFNKASFGIDVRFISKSHEEYGNLAIKYTNGAGYIDLNESLDSNENKVCVMKAKIDTETVNWIMDKVPEMVSDLSGDQEATSDLFSFITDSALVSGIKSGNYGVILDLLKGISNDEYCINVDLDLSSLGLGDDAAASIVLDSRTGEDNHVLNLSLDNVKLGSLGFDADINSCEFKSITVLHAEAYDSLSFLPTVVDQVSAILDCKQTGFALSGSYLDEDNVGFTLDGEGQLDYGNKYGFGTMTIDEYKYKNKGVWYSHKLAVDVDNTTGDFVQNSAYFIYGDPNSSKNVKGKVTVQSVLDLIDIVKTFINDSQDDPKWSKFVQPIMEMMSMSELAEIINSNDYFKFVKNDFIKSINKSGDVLNIVIGGSIFNLASNININVNFVNDKIDSLELVNLCFENGKVLNLRVELKDFDANKVSPVNKSASFMDLSTISLLLKYGINTTANNYYHLTAEIDIRALSIFNLDTFTLHIYVVIQGEYCKIYGVIPDAKISSIAQDYVAGYCHWMKSEFTFETYPDGDPNKLDGVGGYFHFKTTREEGLFSSTVSCRHYKTTGKNLLEGNNMLTYLLQDFLCIREKLMEKIGDISFKNETEERPAGDFTNTFTSTGYQYNSSANRWDIGINLNELTGISALKDLEIKLYGSDSERFTKLWVKLNIANLLALQATINLEDTPVSQADWASSIQSSFNAINGVDFPANKLNNPNSYITY